jgi:hypothetical protein
MQALARMRVQVQMMVPELTILKSEPVLLQHQPEFVPVLLGARAVEAEFALQMEPRPS